MARGVRYLAALAMLLAGLVCAASAETRALLVACSEFVTQPDLGNAASGNLQMIGSALLGAQPRLAELSIEDGTVGTAEALEAAVADAFGEATEEDFSILYLCTHGVLSSADDAQAYLLLGDGRTETPLSAARLCALMSGVQGEKLLILDACFSGAMIGRGEESGAGATPFLRDPSLHVLTSADGREAGWYYDSDRLQTGAVSYFASALSTGLGLYGAVEADLNGDGGLTLGELYGYLRAAVPSSTCQLLSADAGSVSLPAAQGAMLARPLTGFAYGPSLVPASDPTLDFSFTVQTETAVQYRLIEYADGAWDWDGATTFMDGAEGGEALAPGRRTRRLTLSGISPDDSGYAMLQVFSVSGSELILCSERLIAVQGEAEGEPLSLAAGEALRPGQGELSVAAKLGVPAEITVSVFDAQGELVRRLAQSALTRPSPDGVTRVYWDGRDASGKPVPSGDYVLAAEAIVGKERQKAVTNVRVGV